MQAWYDRKGFDTAIHSIPKCVIFLEDLLQKMIDKIHLGPSGLPEKHCPKSGAVLISSCHLTCNHQTKYADNKYHQDWLCALKQAVSEEGSAEEVGSEQELLQGAP